jgi:alanine racemase
MRSVVELKARVVQLRTVARGETIGYGAAWTARRISRLAIVAAGYADGYARVNGATESGDGAEAIVAGHRCQVVGRVSMDLLAVDLTDLPDLPVHRGDFVTLIGGDISVDEIAAVAGLIPYEVLTGLGRRHARRYIEAPVDPEAAERRPRRRNGRR